MFLMLQAIEHAERELRIAPELRLLSLRKTWDMHFHASTMRFVPLDDAALQSNLVGLRVTIKVDASASSSSSAAGVHTLMSTFGVGGAKPVIVRKRGPSGTGGLYCVSDMEDPMIDEDSDFGVAAGESSFFFLVITYD